MAVDLNAIQEAINKIKSQIPTLTSQVASVTTPKTTTSKTTTTPITSTTTPVSASTASTPITSSKTTSSTLTPSTTSTSATNQSALLKSIADTQAKIADLTAQKSALDTYGIGNTTYGGVDTLTKTASGTYEPSITSTDPTAVLAAMNLKTGGSTTTPDYYSTMSDYLKQMQEQQTAYQNALSSQKTAAELFAEAQKASGVSEQQQAVNTTTKLINELEANLNERIGGSLTTEAQRARELAIEQKPLAKQLEAQTIGLTSAQAQAQDYLSLLQGQQEQQLAAAKAPIDYTSSILPVISSMLQYQSPQQQLATTLAQQQLEQNLGLASKSTSIIEKDGRKVLIDTQTGDTIADLGATTPEKRSTQIIESDGKNILVDTQTGKIIKDLGSSVTAAEEEAASAAQSEALNSYQTTNELLNNEEGIKAISGWIQFGSVIPGSAGAIAVNQYNQIKNLLGLENRQKLKGQGQISNFEASMLEKASSALGRNLSSEQLKQQLANVRGVFANAAGMEAPVKVTSPSGQVMEGLASRAEIDALIKEGNTVEYTY